MDYVHIARGKNVVSGTYTECPSPSNIFSHLMRSYRIKSLFFLIDVENKGFECLNLKGRAIIDLFSLQRPTQDEE